MIKYHIDCQYQSILYLEGGARLIRNDEIRNNHGLDTEEATAAVDMMNVEPGPRNSRKRECRSG